MYRILVSIAVWPAMLAILAACDSTTEPPVNSDFPGIVAWDDPPAYVLSQAPPDHVADTSGLEPGPIPTLAIPGLETPDTVDAGASFKVKVTTALPNGCWKPGAVERSTEGKLATLEVYDHGPQDLFQPCILIASFPTREIELQFDQPGEATIRLFGRRIQGEAYDQSEIVETIEKTVVVR